MVFSLALSSSTERPVRSGTAGLGSMAHFAAIFSMREFTTFALEYSTETVGDSHVLGLIGTAHDPVRKAEFNSLVGIHPCFRIHEVRELCTRQVPF